MCLRPCYPLRFCTVLREGSRRPCRVSSKEAGSFTVQIDGESRPLQGVLAESLTLDKHGTSFDQDLLKLKQEMEEMKDTMKILALDCGKACQKNELEETKLKLLAKSLTRGPEVVIDSKKTVAVCTDHVRKALTLKKDIEEKLEEAKQLLTKLRADGALQKPMLRQNAAQGDANRAIEADRKKTREEWEVFCNSFKLKLDVNQRKSVLTEQEYDCKQKECVVLQVSIYAPRMHWLFSWRLSFLHRVVFSHVLTETARGLDSRQYR